MSRRFTAPIEPTGNLYTIVVSYADKMVLYSISFRGRCVLEVVEDLSACCC